MINEYFQRQLLVTLSYRYFLMISTTVLPGAATLRAHILIVISLSTTQLQYKHWDILIFMTSCFKFLSVLPGSFSLISLQSRVVVFHERYSS